MKLIIKKTGFTKNLKNTINDKQVNLYNYELLRS